MASNDPLMVATAADEEADKDIDEESEEDEESGLGISYFWSKWWVDSFVTFDLGIPDGFGEGWMDQWLRYKRVVSESEGFVLDPKKKPRGATGAVYPVDLEMVLAGRFTVRELAKEVSSVALERYNREKGWNVKLESIVRVNWRLLDQAYLYITFMARESGDRDVVEYQAKFCHKLRFDFYPILCRPAPKTTGSICD